MILLVGDLAKGVSHKVCLWLPGSLLTLNMVSWLYYIIRVVLIVITRYANILQDYPSYYGDKLLHEGTACICTCTGANTGNGSHISNYLGDHELNYAILNYKRIGWDMSNGQ